MTDSVDNSVVGSVTKEIPNLPLALRRALEAGDCVLFVGAGVGAHVRDKNGNPAPDGEELARRLACFIHQARGMYW